MPGGANRTRTVFVGNISFDASEEEIRGLFSSVGPVVNLRMVIDKETGRRKGFGFIEYGDTETAFSAVRNLNELELHGRTLRVNIAEQDTKTSNAESSVMGNRKRKGGADGGWEGPPGRGGGAMVPGGGGGMVPGGGGMHAGAQQQQPEVLLPPTSDPIAAYVERLGRAAMFELALQAKHFAAADPEEAARLLSANPPALSALHMVLDRLAGPHWPSQVDRAATDGGASWTSLVRGGGNGGGGAASAPDPRTAPDPRASPQPPPPPQPAAPPAAPAPGGAGGGRYPPSLESAAAAMGVPPAVLEQQLVSLTPAQLNALPPEQQAQVRELQQMLST